MIHDLIFILAYGFSGGFILHFCFKPSKYNSSFLAILTWPVTLSAKLGDWAAKKVRKKLFDNDEMWFI